VNKDFLKKVAILWSLFFYSVFAMGETSDFPMQTEGCVLLQKCVKSISCGKGYEWGIVGSDNYTSQQAVVRFDVKIHSRLFCGFPSSAGTTYFEVWKKGALETYSIEGGANSNEFHPPSNHGNGAFEDYLKRLGRYAIADVERRCQMTLDKYVNTYGYCDANGN